MNLGTIQIDCIDSDSDGFVNIPMLIAWDQNEDNADCTDAFDALPGTTSKCNLNNNYPLPVPVPGQISFTKETLPDGATEDFSFTVLSGATQVDTAILSD